MKKSNEKSFAFRADEIGKFVGSADDALSDFGKNTQIIGLTMGAWSLIDLLHSILKKTGPADVYIATWSAGIKDAHQVAWMMDTGLIRRIALLTDYSYVTRQKRYAMSVEDLFGRENIRCSDLHAKFLLIRNGDYDVTVLTSMNLNANRKCETFQVIESADVAEFHQQFVDHHFHDQQKAWESSMARVGLCLANYFGIKQENKTGHWSDNE